MSERKCKRRKNGEKCGKLERLRQNLDKMGIFGNMKTMRKKGDDKERFEKYQTLERKIGKVDEIGKRNCLGKKNLENLEICRKYDEDRTNLQT